MRGNKNTVNSCLIKIYTFAVLLTKTPDILLSRNNDRPKYHVTTACRQLTDVQSRTGQVMISRPREFLLRNLSARAT